MCHLLNTNVPKLLFTARYQLDSILTTIPVSSMITKTAITILKSIEQAARRANHENLSQIPHSKN
jgi:hypothetical protein